MPQARFVWIDFFLLMNHNQYLCNTKKIYSVKLEIIPLKFKVAFSTLSHYCSSYVLICFLTLILLFFSFIFHFYYFFFMRSCHSFIIRKQYATYCFPFFLMIVMPIHHKYKLNQYRNILKSLMVYELSLLGLV